jgi:hypothetical protein
VLPPNTPSHSCGCGLCNCNVFPIVMRAANATPIDFTAGIMVLARVAWAVLISACVSGVLGDTLPQAVADQYGAKCLNGDPPTYELTRNVSETRWILFLEGE